MKIRKLLVLSTVSLALPLALLGCGGGGGGGSSPRPTSTPVGTGILRVQLRDASNAAVDGIVTVGSRVNNTSGGQVTFNNVPAGSTSVQAEVNGVTTTGTANVAATGTTTFTLRIASGVTPGPTTEPPPPPF